VKIKTAEIVTSCARPADFPVAGLPEVAFLGRSNVGKSSLLNALAQRKKLARTSGTPGKTRLVHFFHVETQVGPLLMVDLPGYGWARVSRRERNSWRHMVEGYLGARDPLRVAVLLQDLRRDFSDDETLLLDWLAERSVPALVALTKVDKLKPMRRAARIRELGRQIGAPADRVVATSAQTLHGIDELWRAMGEFLWPAGGPS
jgi:GTP-binding protein